MDQVGRATRLSPKTGKIDCLVLDLVGNCDRFPLGVEPSLTSSEYISILAVTDHADNLREAKSCLGGG